MQTPRMITTLSMLALVGTSIGLMTSAAQSRIETNSKSNTVEAEIKEPDASQKHAMDMAFNISDAFEYAAEKIEPSVVHITTSDNAPQSRQSGGTGLGSGVIIDSSGYIITNHHVLESGRFITVRLADGRQLRARRIGSFEETDIAVIKVDADDLVAASFADSEATRVGQWVLAVGSPFGFEQTVTAGIVSAKGRGSTSSYFENGASSTRFQEFIQTDAAINPGNSGGPLVDLRGNILGINTAIISRTGSNNGLGFAIPADIAQAVTEQLIDTGTVERGWLGINMGQLAGFEAHKLGIDGGVVIQRLVGDGPAKRAGLQSGDIIVALGGRTTENIVRLSNAIMLTKPNEPVDIEFIRNGDRRSVSAIVTDRDEEMLIAQGGIYIDEIGVKIAPRVLTRSSGRRSLGNTPGFLIADIDRDSPAARQGLQENDFIYQIDGQKFEDAEDVDEYIDDMLSASDPLRIQFYRDGEPMYVDLVTK
jgi:serine protease Do